MLQKTIEEELTSNVDRTVIDLRPWELDNVVLLGHYRYNDVKPELPLYRHKGMLEICFCAKGEQLYQVNGQNYWLRGGDVFVTFPDEPHSTAHYPENRGEMYWLIFRMPDPAIPGFLNLTEVQIRCLFEKLTTLPSRHFKGSSKIKSFLDHVIDLSRQSIDPLNQIRLSNTFVAFFLELIDCSSQLSTRSKCAAISSLLAFIQDNIREQLPINLLTEKVNLSESRFKALFKEAEGLPPHEYILNKKVDLAIELIINANYSIKQAAEETGFSSVHHFSNICKRFTGKRPAQFVPRNYIKKEAMDSLGMV